MKRVGYLWPQLVSFENLLLAPRRVLFKYTVCQL